MRNVIRIGGVYDQTVESLSSQRLDELVFDVRQFISHLINGKHFDARIAHVELDERFFLQSRHQLRAEFFALNVRPYLDLIQTVVLSFVDDLIALDQAVAVYGDLVFNELMIFDPSAAVDEETELEFDCLTERRADRRLLIDTAPDRFDRACLRRRHRHKQNQCRE